MSFLNMEANFYIFRDDMKKSILDLLFYIILLQFFLDNTKVIR